MYFSDEDKKIVEKLKYNKKLKPGYDLLKGCLAWKDEYAFLSDDGMVKLAHLFVVRSYIFHLNLSEVPEILGGKLLVERWNLAVESKVKWPGFEKKRLYLSRADKKYLYKQLEDDRNCVEY